MTGQVFPTDYYVNTLVRLFDTIEYDDTNYTRQERVENLRYSYGEAAKHFAQPLQRQGLKVSPERLEAALSTIVAMVVYSWTKIPREVMAALSIYYTYHLLLDDGDGDPHSEMATFYDDLLQGKPQKHPWLRLMNGHLPKLLDHYESFCAFNIVRSSLDFFQGCWIEQYKFHGFPGSHDFPTFLRRLNGLGHSVGATLFPREQFDEQALFTEVVSAIAQVEHWMVFVNDMISFYKEFDGDRDQTSLINNYCHTEEIDLDQALEKLTQDTLQRSVQLMVVFEGRDPKVEASIKAFIQGYVTWHMCDKRYRMNVVYESCGDGPMAHKFRQYYERAREVGEIQLEEWTTPSVTTLAEQADRGSMWELPSWFAHVLHLRS